MEYYFNYSISFDFNPFHNMHKKQGSALLKMQKNHFFQEFLVIFVQIYDIINLMFCLEQKSHRLKNTEKERVCKMKCPIITIEREYGSGGSVIGKQVAEQLGIPFYNHEILEMASERLGVPVSKLEGAEESSPKSFLYTLLLNSNPSRTMEDNLPVSDKLYITETQIIQELAAQGSCVIVGRCANWILRNNPYKFSVFAYAPKSFRLQYAQQAYHVSEKEIDILLPKIDSRREKFYNINTGGNWHDKNNYALCLNTGKLGIDGAVNLVVAAVQALPQPPSAES